MLELYVTIFSKHLYVDPTVERDIQITITDSSSTPMFGKSNARSGPTLAKVNRSEPSIRHKPIFSFRNPKPIGFQLENYPFELLLQSVKPEKLVQLFTALLLERKIVLIKDEIGDIALII